MVSKKCTLITGGVRSGKSRYACVLARHIIGKRVFIATAQPLDEDMAIRIKKHREERGNEFLTVEEPLYLARAVEAACVGEPQVIVIDCLTFWLNNLYYHFKDDHGKIRQQFDLFLAVLADPSVRIIMVTNEVGLGVMADNRLARTFIDELGILNQKAAGCCEEVILMTAGLPQFIKGRIFNKDTEVTANNCECRV